MYVSQPRTNRAPVPHRRRRRRSEEEGRFLLSVRAIGRGEGGGRKVTAHKNTQLTRVLRARPSERGNQPPTAPSSKASPSCRALKPLTSLPTSPPSPVPWTETAAAGALRPKIIQPTPSSALASSGRALLLISAGEVGGNATAPACQPHAAWGGGVPGTWETQDLGPRLGQINVCGDGEQ